MARHRRLALACVFSIAGMLLAAIYAMACATEYAVPVFSFRRHPDLPLRRFVGGRMGVLQPTFARSYLVIAWRWMNAVGMSQREAEQAMSYYDDRQRGSLNDGWVRGVQDWPAEWRRLRASIPSPPAPGVSPVTNGRLSYDPENHQFALNCADDAYRTAVHTLESRRNRFGAATAAFRSWLAAQDVVFSNCDGEKLTLPAEPSPELPAVVQQDRRYQIAASFFYAAHYSEALVRFQAIAADQTSPWSGISNYLIGRTLYRMANNGEVKAQALRILADSSLSAIHGMTWNLLQRAGLHERDQAYFDHLAGLLSAPEQDDGFREELWNYTDMYDAMIGAGDPNPGYSYRQPLSLPDAARFRSAPMTDWIHSFQARDAAAHARTLEMWKRSRSVPWLLAALVHATGKEPDASALIEAAAGIPRESPAYLTATWHRIRLSAEQGRSEEYRHELDAVLSAPELRDLPSEVNLFRSLRMSAAADLPEFLRFALRTPVLVVWSNNFGEVPETEQSAVYLRKQWEPHASLDEDGVTTLNFSTSFALLEQAALRNGYPAALRAELAMTVFTRGLMLDRDLTKAAGMLESATPGLKPLVEQWRSAPTPAEKRFAAAFLILRRPEARPYLKPRITRYAKPGAIDDFRDNWWCPVDIIQPLQRQADEDQERVVWAVPPPAFFARDSVKTAAEIAELENQGNAAEFLGKIVLSRAKEHPDDARLPEALHNVVVATHLGCADAGTGDISRDAFQSLHRKYPGSEWAKKTPYWYREFSVRDSLRK